MAEIGAGSGSSYPGTLDANSSPEINAPNPGKTKARKEVVEDLAACIIAIETTLGVSPQGSKATVVARIDQEHNADGSHKDTLVVTVSGNNQTVSGRKVFTSGISLSVEGLYGTATGHTAGRTTVGASGAMWFADDIRTSGSIYVGGTNVSTNFNADMVDGYNAGNATGNIPISNGTVNTNLNADTVDGIHATGFWQSPTVDTTVQNAGSVNLLAALTTISTIDLGTVATGDYIFVQAYVNGTQGASASDVFIDIDKSSGTAAISTITNIKTGAVVTANNIWKPYLFGRIRVTTGGTLILKLAGQSNVDGFLIGINQSWFNALVVNP